MIAAMLFRNALLTLAVVVSALGFTARSSSGGDASSSDDLVFAKDGEIYTRSPLGIVRRLTKNSVFDGFPSWSEDRSQIVFVRAARNDDDIWVMSADASGARRLPGSARGAQDLYPAFSPDGRLVVFASNRSGREPDVYVMRADGTKVRRLVAGPRYVQDTQPSFSPDGRNVVFTSNRLSFFNFEIYRVRAADGGGSKRLTFWGSGKDGAPGDDISPSYSPDGKRIAFVSDREGGYAVWTMNAAGRDLREVARHKGHTVVFPRFSPDGGALVYTATLDAPGRQHDRIWTVRVDGGSRTMLGPGAAADW